MQNFNLISAILSRPWLLEKSWVDDNFILVAQLLDGQAVTMPNKATIPNDMPEWANEAFQNTRPSVLTVTAGTVRASFWSSFNEAPKNSLAMIPVVGPISKYYNCGAPGSADMARWVKEAEDSANIDGIILRIDSPGGMVDGTATLADVIAQCSKPVTAFIDDGMCASAAMWIASAADEIILSQPTDTIGSIGVYTTIYDFSERLIQMGIKKHEVYAPQSSQKNKDYKDALKGNYQLIEDQLSFIAETFINTIKQNRSGKLNLKAGDPFKGAMYRAEEAIAIGLADRIASIEEAIEITYANKAGKTTPKRATISQTNMFGNKFPSLSKLSGKTSETISQEEILAVNSELDSQGVTGVRVFNASFQQDAENALSQITHLQSELATVKGALTQAQDQVKNLNTSLESANNALKAEQDAHTITKGQLSEANGKPADHQEKPEAPEDKAKVETKTSSDFTSEADVKLKSLKESMGV